ncbi:MAG: glucuronate isomerase [Anaerolineaceae bacterium]|nr:glucuronate isomerase [Anaerolineaceae bacterium]
MEKSYSDPERYFSCEPGIRKIAMELYEGIRHLGIISPHSHVDPALFSSPERRFGNPAELFIIPDHYVFRMLYSQGIPLEALGVATLKGEVTAEPREVWQTFCAHYYLFAGTPTSLWIQDELAAVFGINEQPCAENAGRLYDRISEALASAEYSPRALFDRFKIEVLCTTDSATDALSAHQSLKQGPWQRRILPTFRPDTLFKLPSPGWKNALAKLGSLYGKEISSYKVFLEAIEERRAFFKAMGAKACDHGVLNPFTENISTEAMEKIFQRALAGTASNEDYANFSAQMLMEMARMSCEDGLVMQLHAGSLRNHNQALYERFGADMGADIPVSAEFTRNLRPLLQRYGSTAGFRLVLFTLDESAYSRELAPLAGHYPAVKLGPPWWFLDSPKGMERYLDATVETAGFYNLAGFNDDTRGFCSIPARHDLWRRISCNWLAKQVSRQFLGLSSAKEIARELAYGLALQTYGLSS